MSWISEARRPVGDVAAALGWTGDDRRGYPCPACREQTRGDRRGAVGVTRGGEGWLCHRCGAKGDGLDYLAFAIEGVRLRDVPDRARIREFVSSSGWTVALPPSLPPPPPPPPRDLTEFWASCRPVPDTDPFIRARALTACPPDLARFTPETGAFPRWWPAGRAKTWRLVTRGYDASHTPVNLHGRAVTPPPEFAGKPGPKTLWARAYCECETPCRDIAKCPTRHEMPSAGVVFWNRIWPQDAQLTIIAEGMTDWLSLSILVGARPVAVYGLTSGGDSAFADIDIQTDVIIATDEDPAGDAYAADLQAILSRRRILRLRPSRLAPLLEQQAAK